MHLVALDPANVAMVHFHIPAELFSQFSIEKDEILGINLDNLNSVMRRCSLGSSIILAREENTLRITIQDKIKRDFTRARELKYGFLDFWF